MEFVFRWNENVILGMYLCAQVGRNPVLRTGTSLLVNILLGQKQMHKLSVVTSSSNFTCQKALD